LEELKNSKSRLIHAAAQAQKTCDYVFRKGDEEESNEEMKNSAGKPHQKDLISVTYQL
jgi:hypothetical protein